MTARDALDWIAFVVGLAGLIAIFTALRSLWRRIAYVLENNSVAEWSMANTVPQALRLPRCRSKARGRIEVLRGDINSLWNRYPEAASTIPRSLQRRIQENEQ